MCRCPWNINSYYSKRASWLSTFGKVELNSFVTTEQPRVFGFGLVSAILGMELSALNILGGTLPLNHTPQHAQSPVTRVHLTKEPHHGTPDLLICVFGWGDDDTRDIVKHTFKAAQSSGTMNRYKLVVLMQGCLYPLGHICQYLDTSSLIPNGVSATTVQQVTSRRIIWSQGSTEIRLGNACVNTGKEKVPLPRGLEVGSFPAVSLLYSRSHTHKLPTLPSISQPLCHV